jgi:SAM-dependent methyltransferase
VRLHRVRVAPIPAWLDAERLLGPGAWQLTMTGASIEAIAELDAATAADLDARLRGVVLASVRLTCDVVPKLARPLVRQARLHEARRQRDRSVGFSRPGVALDDEMRLGLTPELLALGIGEQAKVFMESRPPEQRTVVDACCGAGGNAIGFARNGLRVVAIERDPRRLAAAQHNAKVYGVSERITFVLGDARERVSEHRGALWFVDAPWAVREPSGQLPLLAELVERLDPIQPLWAKVPADFDPALVPGSRPSAWFGASRGDERRVKLVLLERP